MATQEGRSTTPVKEKRLHRPTTTGTLSEDFMGSRVSMKGARHRAQQATAAATKPLISFTAEVENSLKIKERTQALYLNRFAGKLDANNRIIPTDLPAITYHGARRSSAFNIEFTGTLESSADGQLTAEDSYVPPSRSKQISIFPAGELKIFPPRRPNTGCWKLGLRQYEKSNNSTSGGVHRSKDGDSIGESDGEDSFGIDDHSSAPDTPSVLSIGNLSQASRITTNSMKVLNKLKRQDSEGFNLRPTHSAAKLNQYLHAQYATAELPKLTSTQKQNYFGETGTENFYKTYKELKSRGEVLLDGYADLERLVLKPGNKNILLNTVSELERLGVLTPRNTATATTTAATAEAGEETMSVYNDDDDSFNGGMHLTPASPEETAIKPKLQKRLSQETLSLVMEKLTGSSFQPSSPGTMLNTLAPTTTIKPLTAAEQVVEKERLERVSRERFAEMSMHSKLVAVDRKPTIKRSKTNAEMRAVVKASRLDSLPLVKSATAAVSSNSAPMLPIIKGAVPNNVTHTISPTIQTGKSVIGTLNTGNKEQRCPPSPTSKHHAGSSSPTSKHPAGSSSPTSKHPAGSSFPTSKHPAGSSSPTSKHPAGSTSPSSPTVMGEVLHTHSDDEGSYGFSHQSVEDCTEGDDETYHSSKVFVNTPFSGKYNPVSVTGDLDKDHYSVCGSLGTFINRLDEPFEADTSLECSYTPASPRAIFLTGCLQHSIPPVTVALIRKKISSTINLAHMGLGTKIAKVLAPCLSAVPYLQLLNLSDNNLDDQGLSYLIQSISQHKTIEILDISQNTIGSLAAAALADFLGNPECQLQCLRMSNANIDDGECANFVDVLMKNRHLKELDMSNNLLGKDENLNAVQPDFVTGGESLSELLSNPDCPLQTLNLHWNMIRLEGAEVLCNSLRTNSVLTNLDLSYNALGSAAAGVLGDALIENKVLVELNVANNGIDEFGCFTLMTGLRENTSLRNVVLDGNPLGVQGGRILIKVATALGNRLAISAKNCDFGIHNSNFVFNINEPYGEFLLDLSVPYERAILLEILNICETDSTIEFNKLEYCETANGTIFTPFTLVRYDSNVSELSKSETRELRDLTSMQRLAQYSWDDIFHTTQRFCSLDPEVLIKSDLERLLREFKVLDMNNVMSEVFFTLDPMQFGWIDVQEFVGYMIKRAEVAKTRIYDLSHETRLALSSDPKTRYIPASVGRVRVRTAEGFCTSEEQGSIKPVSSSQCKQMLKCAENSSNPLSLLIFGIEGTRLRIEEAKLMYKQLLSKTEDAIMVIAVILQRMRSTEDALRVLRYFIGTDVLRWRRLKQRLGTSLLPLIGIYSGYYHLDLSFTSDRVCLKKLIEKSVKNCDERMQKKLGDTSQNGNWTCFRNEYHPDPHSEHAPDSIRIIPKYFYPLPEKGKVEFDFINISRPDITIHRAVTDDAIVDILLMTRLLDETLVEWAIAKLSEVAAGLRKSALSNGRPVWKSELGRAITVNDTVHSYSNSLNTRKKSLLKSQKREVALKQPVATSNREQSIRRPRGGGEGSKMRNTIMLEKERQREEKERILKAQQPTNTKSVNIQSFRSFNLKGKDHQMKQFWSKRLYEVMYESNGTDELKSAAVLEFLEIMMSTWWVYCRHIALICELFHLGAVAKSSMGSYRVELVVMWFDRILDVQNFEVILAVLSAEEQAALYARIGILNLFNPCKPEGGWQLDLAKWEQRQVAKMLIHLSIQEPGDNWIDPQFVFDHGFLPIPGWSLSVVWLGETGLPGKGILTVEFFSGNGANMLGCLVDRKLRAMLCSLVLCPQRDLQQEYRINKQEMFITAGTDKLDTSIKINFATSTNIIQSKARIPTVKSKNWEEMHENTKETIETTEDSNKNQIKPMVFYRPHAVPTLFALHTQAPQLSRLYYDTTQQKNMYPYTFKEANTHLRTVNIEWFYGDFESKPQDSWHM